MDTSNSSEVTIHDANPEEFTLEDTLGVLRDLKLERDQDLERMYDVQINNKHFAPLSKTNTTEKQLKCIQNCANLIIDDKPEDWPIPKTLDMYTSTEVELAQGIQEMQECVQVAKENLKRKNMDISRLKEKKAGFDKMKEACLTANEITASKTYEQELHITTKMFKEVRTETQRVVSELFPEDDHIRDFLAELCAAYFSSGDDIYVDLVPDVMDAAHFLLEAGLIVYHKYDKSKVRLIDFYTICV